MMEMLSSCNDLAQSLGQLLLEQILCPPPQKKKNQTNKQKELSLLSHQKKFASFFALYISTTKASWRHAIFFSVDLQINVRLHLFNFSPLVHCVFSKCNVSSWAAFCLISFDKSSSLLLSWGTITSVSLGI